jgi:hypothetical protein
MTIALLRIDYCEQSPYKLCLGTGQLRVLEKSRAEQELSMALADQVMNIPQSLIKFRSKMSRRYSFLSPGSEPLSLIR